MPTSKPWWVCSKCGRPVAKRQQRRVLEAIRDHMKDSCPGAGFSLRQVRQQRRKKAGGPT